MNDEDAIAWLARRVGMGLTPGELDRRVASGPDAYLDELLDADAAGLPPLADPWASVEVYRPRESALNPYIMDGINLWLEYMQVTPRPLEEWMSFFWHHHFALSLIEVRPPVAAINHGRLLRRHALGNFRDLLRDVTVDAGMLVFLNGDQSTGENPNENYGRELLELYALGIGNFTEDDVVAAAFALTGWTVTGFEGTVSFDPSRHDDSPRTLVGVSGVHDVDTVIDAVTGHQGCAPFIATKLGRAILGDIDDGLVASLASTFVDNDLEIRPLVRAIVEAGLDGAGSEIISEPVPWFIGAARAIEPDMGRSPLAIPALRSMGQVPMAPPNVGGFPKRRTYLGSSSVAGRFALAAEMAARTSTGNPARRAAMDRDWNELGRQLARPAGFSATTVASLDSVGSADTAAGTDGIAALGLALASPEMMIA